MTPEEKEKLYNAIGYQEGGGDLQLPEDYVALKLNFNLKLLELNVRNETGPSSLTQLNETSQQNLRTVLSLQVSGVSCELDQRPASSGLRYT